MNFELEQRATSPSLFQNSITLGAISNNKIANQHATELTATVEEKETIKNQKSSTFAASQIE